MNGESIEARCDFLCDLVASCKTCALNTTVGIYHLGDMSMHAQTQLPPVDGVERIYTALVTCNCLRTVLLFVSEETTSSTIYGGRYLRLYSV